MSVCRLCASAASDCASIFSRRQEKTIAEMAQLVASVEVTNDDPYSTLVCADCIELTLDAFNYVNRVRDADLRFKEQMEEIVEYVESDGESQRVEVLDVNILNLDDVELREHSATTVDMMLEADEASVEVPEADPEEASKELFNLFIESINQLGADKWYKLKGDSDFMEMTTKESNTLLDLLDEVESSDEEEPAQGTEQVARCCSHFCKKIFRSRKELLEHGLQSHGSDRQEVNHFKPFKCLVCYQQFETRKALLAHLRRLIRDYRCHFCNIYFNAPSDKIAHVNTSHVEDCKSTRRYRIEEQPRKICCGCESTFETAEELYQHGVDVHQSQNSHDIQDRDHQCNICFKSFKSKTGLRTHQVLVYKPKTFSCQTCGKAFECASKLQTHVTIHITERNFGCDTCGGTFRTATDLRGHMRIHTERSLVCSTCGARFHKPAHLRSHQKTHDDNAYEYSCSFCSKQFKEKSNWKVHLKVHTREKQYPCQYCPKEFRYTTDRKRHEMSHTGDYPHGCSICGKAFARPGQLQSHLKVCQKREK